MKAAANPGDQGVMFQAFSHLSRMHSSSSTTFFATILAYAAYVLALYRFPLWTVGKLECALLLGPLPIVGLQALKYFATNMALRKCGQDIDGPGKTNLGEPKPNLHEYLFGSEGLYSRGGWCGKKWLSLTQCRLAGWVLGGYVIVFLVVLVLVLRLVQPCQ